MSQQYKRRNNKRDQPSHLINYKIPFPKLRIVDQKGEQLGIMSKDDGLKLSKSAGLDLVIIAEKADPPVAKIIDFAKFKYEQKKANKEKARTQRANRVELKEIQMRPGTQDHDVSIKAKKAVEFLSKGHKVKIVIKFRGREQAYKNQAKLIIENLISYCEPIEVKFDRPIDFQGRNVWCILTRKEA
jgi:translation initiation factor IF-3